MPPRIAPAPQPPFPQSPFPSRTRGIASAPVAPTPVAPTPVASAPVTPTPVTPTPVAPTPTAFGPFALAAASLLASLGVSVAGVALPLLARDLSLPVGAAQRVVTAYLLAMTLSVVVAGRLADRPGRGILARLGQRGLFLSGAALFTAASLASGLAPGIGSLVLARVAQGAGAAAMIALALPLLRGVVPADRTGRAVGMLATASAVGTALGPSAGGMIAGAFGWRAVFLALVPLGLAVMLLAGRSLPPPAPPGGGGVRASADPVGLALLGVALSAFTVAAAPGGLPPPARLVLVLLALTAALAFVRAEARHPAPLVPLHRLAAAGLSRLLAVNAMIAAVMMSTLVVGPFYLAGPAGLSPAATGAAMALGPLVSVASGLPAGRLTDRLGSRAVLRAGLALMAAGTLGLALLPPVAGLAGYLAAVVILTPGYQMAQSANTSALMLAAPDRDRGLVSGLIGLTRNLGLLAGTSALGAVFAVASEGSVLRGVGVTYGVAVPILLAALALTLRPRRA